MHIPAPPIQSQVKGRVLSEAEYRSATDLSYIVSFDDVTLQVKRACGDDVLYFDLRQQVRDFEKEITHPIKSPLI
jgi:hypothetical protein